jgi:hypothetical protein
LNAGDRVIRGGSFLTSAEASLRAASREAENPTNHNTHSGFRCARNTVQTPSFCKWGEFDGASYARAASFDLADAAHTVEAWVYYDPAGTGDHPVISIGRLTFSRRALPQYGDVVVQYTAHNRLDAPSALGQTSDGAWHHLAYVYTGGGYTNPSSFRYYIDGAEHLATSFNGNASKVPIPTSGGTDIGREPTESSPAYRFHHGRMRDLRVSSGERYTAPFVPSEYLSSDGTTLAFWRFNEGSGAATADQSGNGHDATLNGVTLVDNCGN